MQCMKCHENHYDLVCEKCDDKIPKWIKCSDRLPEINKKVLALIENRRCICEWGGYVWYDDYFIDTPTERFFDSYFDIIKYINDKITHWMELPQTPRET